MEMSRMRWWGAALALALAPISACGSDLPPAHIGVLESGVTERPGTCTEKSDRWGCLVPGEKVVLGFLQDGELVAQVPTYAGSRFRIELPPGRYQIKVIEPSGTYVAPPSITVIGGTMQRRVFLWPVDERAAQQMLESPKPPAG